MKFQHPLQANHPSQADESMSAIDENILLHFWGWSRKKLKSMSNVPLLTLSFQAIFYHWHHLSNSHFSLFWFKVKSSYIFLLVTYVLSSHLAS